MRKYIKKVIVTGEAASPESRAQRLKRVRNLANLTRKAMCDKDTININTYKGWEIGRYGGLPIDGARKVTDRVYHEGVLCSTEWLLYGSGTPPTVIPNFSPSTDTVAHPLSLAVQEKLMNNELQVFARQFGDVSIFKVQDDSMTPLYKPEEYVAGINYYGEDIQRLLDQPCIVKTPQGNTWLRIVKPGDGKGLFHLCGMNLQAALAPPLLCNVEIISAAPVIRHLRNDLNV